MHIVATVYQQPVEESEYGSADLFSGYNFDSDVLDDLGCYKRGWTLSYISKLSFDYHLSLTCRMDRLVPRFRHVKMLIRIGMLSNKQVLLDQYVSS